MKKFKQLGLIGCGMMGGSFALAAKKAGVVERVVGYSKSPQNAELAKQMGVIDASAASILQAAMGSDLVIVSVPVAATFEVFKALQFGLAPDALVMDVGSTKQSVIEAVVKVFGMLPPNFIPAHPIAGKEKAGTAEADVHLYAGKRVILTPSRELSSDAAIHEKYLQLASDVWRAIGMSVAVMPADQHDAIFAAVSHVPHLLSFAFINSLNAQSAAPDFWKLAGPGFRDFTRIAASDPDVWRDILIANRKEILRQTGAMQLALSQLEYAMRVGDPVALKALIEPASHSRTAWTMNNKAVDNADD
jgi:prephenate dehydrogenase